MFKMKPIHPCFAFYQLMTKSKWFCYKEETPPCDNCKHQLATCYSTILFSNTCGQHYMDTLLKWRKHWSKKSILTRVAIELSSLNFLMWYLVCTGALFIALDKVDCRTSAHICCFASNLKIGFALILIWFFFYKSLVLCEGREKTILLFKKVFFQRACRIILGPPKHVLHLVWHLSYIQLLGQLWKKLEGPEHWPKEGHNQRTKA